MLTFRVSTDVPADRRVVIHLPQEIPTGRVDLVVTCDAQPAEKRLARTSLLKWAEENAEDFGEQLDSSDVSTFTGRRY